MVCPTPAQQFVFQEYVRTVNEYHERVECIETELQEKAKGWRARAFDRFQLAF